MTYTRKQYLNRECSHREYYSQFVEPYVRDRVSQGIGTERILASTDPHLNDIPLKEWDRLGPVGPRDLWEALGDTPTFAGRTCIYKEAARQIRELSKAEEDASR